MAISMCYIYNTNSVKSKGIVETDNYKAIISYYIYVHNAK